MPWRTGCDLPAVAFDDALVDRRQADAVAGEFVLAVIAGAGTDGTACPRNRHRSLRRCRARSIPPSRAHPFPCRLEPRCRRVAGELPGIAHQVVEQGQQQRAVAARAHAGLHAQLDHAGLASASPAPTSSARALKSTSSRLSPLRPIRESSAARRSARPSSPVTPCVRGSRARSGPAHPAWRSPRMRLKPRSPAAARAGRARRCRRRIPARGWPR